jgi:P-type E1-E2 ATPase
VLDFEIPGRDVLVVKNAVFDFNGTLAVDGQLVPGVSDRLNQLARHVRVYVVSADTFGTVEQACREVECTVTVLAQNPVGPEKAQLVQELGALETTAFGNGANDAPMLAVAGFGVVVLGGEGAATETLGLADVVVRNINEGLDLLLKPGRLIATLRR